jgi:UDP-glucuronate 4-epimerase
MIRAGGVQVEVDRERVRMTERFLVTGSAGCIGAWTVARLLKEETDVIAFDVSDDDRRLRLLLDEEPSVDWVTGDVRDFDTVLEVLKDSGITHVIHLAALQVPFCKADPVLGSQVNVTGTINILEAIRQAGSLVRGFSYASSVAVFGPADRYEGGRVTDSSPLHPTTLYGVFKQSNETAARVYADDWGVGSVGLRPCIVYGPGRDQGLTSDPTKAMLAAAAGKSGHIAFGGSSTFHHADDVAATFVAAARMESTAARVYNMGGIDATVGQVADLIAEAVGGKTKVTWEETPLPLPSSVDGTPLDEALAGEVTHRSLTEGIAESIAQFERLLSDGRLPVLDDDRNR